MVLKLLVSHLSPEGLEAVKNDLKQFGDTSVIEALAPDPTDLSLLSHESNFYLSPRRWVLVVVVVVNCSSGGCCGGGCCGDDGCFEDDCGGVGCSGVGCSGWGCGGGCGSCCYGGDDEVEKTEKEKKKKANADSPCDKGVRTTVSRDCTPSAWACPLWCPRTPSRHLSSLGSTRGPVSS